MGEREIPNELPGVNHKFPSEADARLVSFSHFWAATAQEQILHYNNRKYQFVYLAGLSAVTMAITFSQALATSFSAVSWTLIGASGLGLIVSSLVVGLLGTYIDDRKDLRSHLTAANYQYLVGNCDVDSWAEKIREAYISFVRRHNDTRARHPVLFRLLDFLT